MEMELREIKHRVCKLEEILTRLAKWTNFDLHALHNFNSNSSATKTKLPAVDVGVEGGHHQDAFAHVQLEDDVDLDLVYKVEVDPVDDYHDAENQDLSLEEEEYEYETVETNPRMKEEHCDDYSPTPTQVEVEETPSPCVSGSGSGSGESGLESKRKSLRNLHMTMTPLTPQHEKKKDVRQGQVQTGLMAIGQLTARAQYQCPICPNTYTRKSDLGQHLKSVHFSKSSCKCPKCPKIFSDLRNIKRHLKQVHASEKSFLCHLCPFATNTQDNLKSHFNSTHHQDMTDMRYFHCYFCGARLKSYDQLKRHLRQHTGEKPYSCSTCPFSAEELSNLKQHVRLVHTTDQTRTIPCPKCPTMLASAKELAQHAKLHKRIQYRCNICSYGAINSSILRKHVMENHKQASKAESDFQCPYPDCIRNFKNQHYLQRHIRFHTGEEMPFKCGECPYVTGKSNNLTRHLKRCKGKRKRGGGGEGEGESL